MKILSLVSLAAMLFAGVGAVRAEPRVSGPAVHANLAVYFVHGPSAPGPAPLTLEEALASGAARVTETGSVNELLVETLGAEEVFIQQGDIVKGGKQDRVLSVSLILPGRSGPVPIASFCVEQGRWRPRGVESARTFSSAAASANSRDMKRALLAREKPGRAPDRQREVWANVARAQGKLAEAVGAPVAAPQSATSLQLSLENARLREARKAYLDALAGAPGGDDVIGYVVAVNGRIVTADVYASNALFRKMWRKQIEAAATEALGESGAPAQPAPPAAAALAFLADADLGGRTESRAGPTTRLASLEGEKVLASEAGRASGAFVHRAYVAK